MLPAPARLKNSHVFRATVRHGVRVGRPTLVMHADLAEYAPDSGATTQVGFVVSKQVGNAVTRNRVKRRLRHLAAHRLMDATAIPLSQPVHLVVRALPAAATQPERLQSDFVSAWDASLKRLHHREQR